MDEQPDSNDPTILVTDSDNAESPKTSSDMDGSTFPGSHQSSSSDVEVMSIQKTTRMKKTPKSTSTNRDAMANAPSPSKPNPDADKVSEPEL